MTRSHVPLALPMVGNDKFLKVLQVGSSKIFGTKTHVQYNTLTGRPHTHHTTVLSSTFAMKFASCCSSSWHALCPIPWYV